MNYGRPLYTLIKKSLEHPRGRPVAWNIEATEARGLIRRMGKRARRSTDSFELVPTTLIGGIDSMRDYLDTSGASRFSGN